MLLKAAVMGIVEGLTEFLPISSTGHLILAGQLLGMQDHMSEATVKVFDIAIQTGAIFAVILVYWQRLSGTVTHLGSSRDARRFALNVLIGFLPAVVLGLLIGKMVKAHLFTPIIVASAFIVGGLIILWAERRPASAVRVHSVDDMTALDALKVGLVQCFAMIPGTSRSGSTIIGGMLFGLDRKVATEFSFFLAIPIMFAATAYDVLKHWQAFSMADVPVFGVGFVAAFLSAFLAVRGLLRFVATHTFVVFAWYRIVFGLLILLTWKMGWVSWTA